METDQVISFDKIEYELQKLQDFPLIIFPSIKLLI